MPAASATPADDDLPRGAVACLAVAAFGSGISMRCCDALLPRLAQDFGLPLGTVAQVIGLFATAYGLAQFGFGPIGDRFGKYRVIAWAAAVSALTALGCALAPGFESLRWARALAGLTAAAVIPLSLAWLGDVVPYERRQPILARFLIGQILGFSTGVWLGGLAADLGWRQLPFIVIAGLYGSVSVVLLNVGRRLPARARVQGSADGNAVSQAVAAFAGVLRQGWARWVLALVFLEGACLFGPFAFIATHVHETHGVSLALAGSVVMFFGAGGMVFAVGSGGLVARLGETGLACWGAVIVMGALLMIGVGPGELWAMAGSAALGLGYYMLHNTLQVNATQMAPERRGAAVAAFASCFFIGQSCGVALCGALLRLVGTRGLMLGGAAGVLAVGLVFAARLHARRAVR